MSFANLVSNCLLLTLSALVIPVAQLQPAFLRPLHSFAKRSQGFCSSHRNWKKAHEVDGGDEDTFEDLRDMAPGAERQPRGQPTELSPRELWRRGHACSSLDELVSHTMVDLVFEAPGLQSVSDKEIPGNQKKLFLPTIHSC